MNANLASARCAPTMTECILSVDMVRQAVISACDKGGRLDKALEVYADMEAAGLEADLITFSNLVSGTQ